MDKELINQIAVECGLKKKDIESVLKIYAKCSMDQLLKTGKYRIWPLGTLTIHQRKQHRIRCVSSGKLQEADSCKIVKFKSSVTLKREVKRLEEERYE